MPVVFDPADAGGSKGCRSTRRYRPWLFHGGPFGPQRAGPEPDDGGVGLCEPAESRIDSEHVGIREVRRRRRAGTEVARRIGDDGGSALPDGLGGGNKRRADRAAERGEDLPARQRTIITAHARHCWRPSAKCQRRRCNSLKMICCLYRHSSVGRAHLQPSARAAVDQAHIERDQHNGLLGERLLKLQATGELDCIAGPEMDDAEESPGHQ